jgi:hypothetical protein
LAWHRNLANRGDFEGFGSGATTKLVSSELRSRGHLASESGNHLDLVVDQQLAQGRILARSSDLQILAIDDYLQAELTSLLKERYPVHSSSS